ncbi:hypothetical protein, partial [Paenibacillus sp. IHB B 3415]|uniref:hypothetical protein n=1 Tax=Paenibacillus sp. IHB B 3415 TaxID=867080 RepID=UPI001F169D85
KKPLPARVWNYEIVSFVQQFGSVPNIGVKLALLRGESCILYNIPSQLLGLQSMLSHSDGKPAYCSTIGAAAAEVESQNKP